MYQTGYKGLEPLSTQLPYNGGFCRWWYTPWDNLQGWPIIDPATQMFNGPLTVADPWFGPIKVPNGELGFTETPKRDKVGIPWELKVNGFYPGDSPRSRINLGNMMPYEYVIVGKLRAGGMYLVIGAEDRGAEWTANYQSKGSETAGSDFNFSFVSLNKAIILPSFNEAYVTNPPGYSAPVQPPAPPGNTMERITYTNEQQVVIPWTTARQQLYGNSPVIQVFYTDPDNGLQMNTNPIILMDAQPPNMTQITVKINAPGPGFITLSL